MIKIILSELHGKSLREMKKLLAGSNAQNHRLNFLLAKRLNTDLIDNFLVIILSHLNKVHILHFSYFSNSS